MRNSICKNKNIIFIFFIIISCSNDDSNIDSSLKLNSYIEPYINFLVDEETFIADNGPADERIFPANPGFHLAYNRSLEGVIEYRYIFTVNNTSFPEGAFTHINVRLEPNLHNLNLVRNALTEIYGEPDLFVDSESDVLIFPPTSTYEVELLYTRDLQNDENPNLIVIYDGLN